MHTLHTLKKTDIYDKHEKKDTPVCKVNNANTPQLRIEASFGGLSKGNRPSVGDNPLEAREERHRLVLDTFGILLDGKMELRYSFPKCPPATLHAQHPPRETHLRRTSRMWPERWRMAHGPVEFSDCCIWRFLCSTLLVLRRGSAEGFQWRQSHVSCAILVRLSWKAMSVSGGKLWLSASSSVFRSYQVNFCCLLERVTTHAIPDCVRRPRCIHECGR